MGVLSLVVRLKIAARTRAAVSGAIRTLTVRCLSLVTGRHRNLPSSEPLCFESLAVQY